MLNADALPPFTDDPVDRLRHTLAAYPNEAGDAWAISATSNFVPDHRRTGLTWGDLRSLLARLDD